MDEWGEQMGFDPESPIGCLNIIPFAHSAHFSGKTLLILPIRKMLDD